MRIPKTLFSRGPAALLLSFMLPLCARAEHQFSGGFSEADFYAVIPEVISATRISQKLTEAPASISIIDQDMIRASGAINITDLFRLVPGFQAYHVNSNKFGVTYHGVSDDFPRRLEVLIDGRSVYLPLLSTVDWNSLGISLDDIERIEVVRGSNVPAYGSNAFLGAINIVTRSPYSETESSLSVLGGSQGTRRVEGRFSTALGSSQTRVSAGHDQNDGSDRFNDGARSNYLNISSGLTPTIADTLSFQAGASDGYADRGDLDRTYKPIVKREHRANYQHLRWNHLADLNNEFKLSAYHNYLDLSTPQPSPAELVKYVDVIEDLTTAEVLQAANPDFRLDNEHGTAELYDIELQHTYQPPSYPASLLWGLGHRKEFSSSPVLMQDLGRVDEERWRLFGNLELQPADQLTANLGAMLETSSSSNAGARLSPRAALNYRLDEQSVIRTAYSRAYRMPSLLESNTRFTLYDPAGDILDIVTQPDPDIGPEQIRTWEIGYYRAFSTVRGHLDLRIFHEYIDDAIDTYRIPVADMDGRVSLRSNNSTWENSGAEVQLRLQPLSRFWFVLNYAYINTTDYCQDEGPADGGLECRKTPPTPLHTASALLNLRLPAHWDLSLAQYYVDEVRWGEGGHRDAYDRTDVRLAREWKLLGGQRLSGALVMQNALGNKYAEFYKYNEFDQRTYLQLKLEF